MEKLWGTPVLTLTKIVKNLMIEQGNSNQNHYADNLVRALNAYKDMMKDTLWSVRYKALTVDKRDNSITLPADLWLLCNINVVNSCGDLVPLAANPKMNTYKLLVPEKKCSCDSCKGTGSLCDAFDAIQVVNEEVLINTYPFNMRTWIQKCGDGLIRKVIERPYPVLPYPDGVPPEVTIVTEYQTLCNLDVTETNCIKPTESNHRKLLQYCGAYIMGWQSSMCGLACNYGGIGPQSPAMNLIDMNPHNLDHQWIKDYWCENNYFPQSNYGYWNWEANALDRIILKMIRTDKVVICYRTNGEGCNGDEIVVPEYALDAMMFGIVWRRMAWSPSFNRAEKKGAEDDYEKAKDKLRTFLNPADITAVYEMQDVIPKW